jgi:hypothetical protein
MTMSSAHEIWRTSRPTEKMTGSLSLLDHPGDTVRVSCERCGRSGQYRKATLIERFGPDIALPDLRHEIAQCERRGKLGDGCRVHYVALRPTH